MGVCGRFIDSLGDEQRDRLVRADDWCTEIFLDRSGGRCLVGHAGAVRFDPERGVVFGDSDVYIESKFFGLRSSPNRFDALVHRFGMDRIVRCVKLRAGASVEDLTDQPEPVEAR